MKVLHRLFPVRPAGGGAEMSFVDHLEELRGVLLTCLGALLILSIGGWFVSGFTLDFLVRYTVGEAQFIKPQEAFFTRFKLALLIGFIVGLPYIAFQIWSFVVPGLLRRERRIVLPLVLWSTLLFLIGVAFSALALTPVILKFLQTFATENIQPNLAVGYLLDFYMRMGLACGLLFQLPLVVAILSLFGVITPSFMKKFWRHAVVLILILAAVVTPADPLSQLMLGIPIILLYFVSIYICVAIHRSKGRDEEGDEAPPPPPDDTGPTAEPEAAEETPPDAPEETEASTEEPPADEEAPPEADAEKQHKPRYLHPPDEDWSI